MFRRTGLALVAVVAAATSHAAIIDVNTLLTNPSFEDGNQAGPYAENLPIGWSAIASSPLPGGTSQPITSAQYSPLFVPDGTHAAKLPTPWGSGQLYQFTSATYNAGDTYQLTFWIGTPLTLPDNTTPAAKAALFQASFLVGAVNVLKNTTAFVIPEIGQWAQYTLEYTATAADAGKEIGVRFRVESGAHSNDRILNLDIAGGGPPPTIPEPGTLALLGLGLVGLGAARRFRKNV